MYFSTTASDPLFFEISWIVAGGAAARRIFASFSSLRLSKIPGTNLIPGLLRTLPVAGTPFSVQ